MRDEITIVDNELTEYTLDDVKLWHLGELLDPVGCYVASIWKMVTVEVIGKIPGSSTGCSGSYPRVDLVLRVPDMRESKCGSAGCKCTEIAVSLCLPLDRVDELIAKLQRARGLVFAAGSSKRPGAS